MQIKWQQEGKTQETSKINDAHNDQGTLALTVDTVSFNTETLNLNICVDMIQSRCIPEPENSL